MAQQPISSAQISDVPGSKVVGDIPGNSENVNGIIAIENGGTGVDNKTDALNALLPSQTGLDNYVLKTNGTAAVWGQSGTVFGVGLSPGTTGLTVTGSPISTNGTFTLGGTLNVANGGTGSGNKVTALNNLLPTQGNTNIGKALITNGTNAAWGSTVTSVGVSGGTTGLTTSGSPIETSGTITLGGTLNIENGGTGAISRNQAVNNLLPAQSGSTNGLYIKSDGSNVSWQPITITPSGSNQNIQYNNNGSMAGASGVNLTAASTLQLGLGTSSTFNILSTYLTPLFIKAGASAYNGGAAPNIILQPGDAENHNFLGPTVGGNLILRAGNALGYPQGAGSTGGTPGAIVFQAPASLPGANSTPSYVERFRISWPGAWSLGSSGSNFGTSGQAVVSAGSGAAPAWGYPTAIGSAAPATNATTGFGYIPVTTGTPTGVPTAVTGFVPIVADSGGNKLWVYINGSWKSANLS
jgi:hypothetical protein